MPHPINKKVVITMAWKRPKIKKVPMFTGVRDVPVKVLVFNHTWLIDWYEGGLKVFSKCYTGHLFDAIRDFVKKIEKRKDLDARPILKLKNREKYNKFIVPYVFKAPSVVKFIDKGSSYEPNLYRDYVTNNILHYKGRKKNDTRDNKKDRTYVIPRSTAS